MNRKISTLITFALTTLALAATQTSTNTVSALAFNGSYSQLRGYTFSPTGTTVSITWNGYMSPSGSNAYNVKVVDQSGGGTGTIIYDSGDIAITGTASSPGSNTRTINVVKGRPYLITLNDHGYGLSTGTFSYVYSTYTSITY